MRRLGLDRNPLRRRTDRIEACIATGLLAVFLVGAPLSGIAAGRWAQQGAQREQQAQQSWHQIGAVLLRDAPQLPRYAYRASWNNAVFVSAQWVGPDGQDRVGDVPAVPGTRAGRTVQVWVDGTGRATGPPLQHSQLVSRVFSAAALAPIALAFLLLGLARLVRWPLNRRRLADWEAAWTTIGPRWTRHH